MLFLTIIIIIPGKKKKSKNKGEYKIKKYKKIYIYRNILKISEVI